MMPLHTSRNQKRLATFLGTALAVFAAPIFAACAAARADVPDDAAYTFPNSPQMGIGNSPIGRLVEGPDGDFYGVVQQTRTNYASPNMGGAVYKISPAGAAKSLYDFAASSAVNPGFSPNGIIIGSDGNIYGAAEYGGASTASDPRRYGDGILFKLTPAGEFTVLHNFSGSDGANPMGGVAQGPDGALYGVTQYGGADGADAGALYRCTTSGGFQLLHSFGDASDPADGAAPTAAPLASQKGFLYGTTTQGGQGSAGVVYSINLATGAETIVHTFGEYRGDDGYSPSSSLVQDASGSLYGTTSGGGDDGLGTVYKMAIDGSNYAVLHSFDDFIDTVDGFGPEGLALGGDGNLYGVTFSGGAFDAGAAYKLTPTGDETVLRSFNSNDAEHPFSSLVQGYNGSLYGISPAEIFELKTGLPDAPGAISAFVLSKSSATGGDQHVDGIVTLKAPAGPGGVRVALHSSRSDKTVIDPYAYVAEGASVTSFRVTTRPVGAPIAVAVSVSTGGASLSAPLTITPAAPLSSLTADKTTLTGGTANATLTLTLASPAPSGGERVSVATTDNNAADVPLTVLIPAGATSASFQATTHNVSRDTTATITANSGGVTRSATLSINT